MTLASKISLSFVLALLACLPATSVRAGITYEMVTVGNAGNASDATGYGAVAYSYQIGKYDVTIGSYAAFLNAVDGTGANTYGLYNSNMSTDLNVAGISYSSGAAAGSKYSVMNNGGGSASRPITYVSWFDAARFANWMSNGQGNVSTETGAYTLGGATSGNAVAANPGAAFTIPTENEWYKAAFYSPSKGGTSAPGYYLYATQSDSIPGNNDESPSNQANYNNGVYSVTGVGGYSASQNYLTDVGAFSGSASFYGTFDQSGNVFQWNDLTNAAGALRGSRGEDWGGTSSYYLSSSGRYEIAPSVETWSLGFRLASPVAVPEPSTAAMVLAALVCGSCGLWRKRPYRGHRQV
jgi:sulfatase modifying factor 1